MLLFRWNRQALSIPDSLGRLPLSVAQSRGHVRLARCLEELQRQEAAAELPLALSPPSSSPDTGEGCPPSLQGEAVVGRGGVARAPLPSPTPLAGLSSVSSPSELSDGTFSVTSAYSSAPDGSPPPAPVLASEMAMEETMPGQLSSGAPEGPLFLMDCEATNPQEPVPSRPPFPPAPEGGAASEEADSPPAVDVIPVGHPTLLLCMELRARVGVRVGRDTYHPTKPEPGSGFALRRRDHLPSSGDRQSNLLLTSCQSL